MILLSNNLSNPNGSDSIIDFDYIISPDMTNYVPFAFLSKDFYLVNLNLQSGSITYKNKPLVYRQSNSSNTNISRLIRFSSGALTYGSENKYIYGYSFVLNKEHNNFFIVIIPSNLYKKIYEQAIDRFVSDTELYKVIMDNDINLENNPYILGSFLSHSYLDLYNQIEKNGRFIHNSNYDNYVLHDIKSAINVDFKNVFMTMEEMKQEVFSFGELQPFSKFSELDDLIKESVSEYAN